MDWKGLFDWSMKYNDGTWPSSFEPMSKQDRDWLEKAFSEFTMNEAQEMKECLEFLMKYEHKEEEHLLEKLDKLTSIIDIHPVNAINFTKMGGLKVLLEIIFFSKSEDFWYETLLLFSNVI